MEGLNKNNNVKQEKKDASDIKELSLLIEGRDILSTQGVLNDIIKSTNEKNLKEISELLLCNQKMITASTIARGDTFDNKSDSQAILRGSVEDPLVQVAIKKGNFEPVNLWKGEYKFVSLEEDNIENYNRTVLHELLHTFTRYIVATCEMKKEELLSEIERTFYFNVLDLHKKFLEKNSTGDKYLDKLDEYIVKSMTSNISDNGQYDQYQYDSVYNEFKKLYLNNDRNIKSISIKIQDSINK